MKHYSCHTYLNIIEIQSFLFSTFVFGFEFFLINTLRSISAIYLFQNIDMVTWKYKKCSLTIQTIIRKHFFTFLNVSNCFLFRKTFHKQTTKFFFSFFLSCMHAFTLIQKSELVCFLLNADGYLSLLSFFLFRDQHHSVITRHGLKLYLVKATPDKVELHFFENISHSCKKIRLKYIWEVYY
jgi:hypothetical protein